MDFIKKYKKSFMNKQQENDCNTHHSESVEWINIKLNYERTSTVLNYHQQ